MDKQDARRLATALLRTIASDFEHRQTGDDEVADFLSRMADLFRNHGCNDFWLEEVFPDERDRQKLIAEYFDQNPKIRAEYEGDGIDTQDVDQLQDYSLMIYAAQALSSQPDGIPCQSDPSRISGTFTYKAQMPKVNNA